MTKKTINDALSVMMWEIWVYRHNALRLYIENIACVNNATYSVAELVFRQAQQLSKRPFIVGSL